MRARPATATARADPDDGDPPQMIKLLAAAALAAGLWLGAAPASADALVPAPVPYYGFGFSDGNLDVPGDGQRSLGTASATVGVRLLPILGLELEIGVASDDTDSILADPLVNYQALMARIGWRWDRFGAYGLVGQARLDIDEDLSPVESGNVFGAGLNFFGNETTALNLHVLRFGDEDFTTATIGFQHYFGGFR